MGYLYYHISVEPINKEEASRADAAATGRRGCHSHGQ
jgi:hypothetical protein